MTEFMAILTILARLFCSDSTQSQSNYLKVRKLVTAQWIDQGRLCVFWTPRC